MALCPARRSQIRAENEREQQNRREDARRIQYNIAQQQQEQAKAKHKASIEAAKRHASRITELARLLHIPEHVANAVLAVMQEAQKDST
jgi:hypothetical protein